MPEALSLKNVTKRYKQGPAVIEALSHVFQPGTATGLVGPNGSGKTTLLRLLSVVSFPTEGRVTYGDLDIHARPHDYLARAGIVHAEAALPEYLSAAELLAWVLRARGQWGAAAPERIAAVLDDLLLDERRENLIGTYSSGMTKKAQIAAALLPAPDVLLMDEPLRSLDAATTERVVERLRAFKERGGVLIVASHLDGPLRALADDFIQLGQEKTVQADRADPRTAGRKGTAAE